MSFLVKTLKEAEGSNVDLIFIEDAVHQNQGHRLY